MIHYNSQDLSSFSPPVLVHLSTPYSSLVFRPRAGTRFELLPLFFGDFFLETKLKDTRLLAAV